MNAGSSVEVLTSVRKYILNYVPVGGVDLRTEFDMGSTMEARYYNVQAPDTGTYPYVVQRLINQQTAGNNPRIRADLEVLVFSRPRSKQVEAETIADRIAAAMFGYTNADGQLTFSRSCQRDTLPPTGDPGDRELVQVRLLFEVVFWPTFLAVQANV